MKLYHGTILEYAENIIKNGILVDYKEAVRGTDFGVGFYTTNYAPLAINTAKTKSLYHKDDALRTAPVVVIMSFNISDARGFNCKNFNRYDNEWKTFVCANRYEQVIQNNIDMDSNKDRKYDMVTGAVADSTMIDIRRSLKDNDYCITDSILGSIMPYKIGSHIPIQISFHNQDLVGCIRLLGYDIIPSLTLVKSKNGYKLSNYAGCSHFFFGNDLCYFFTSSVLVLFIMLRMADFEINS